MAEDGLPKTYVAGFHDRSVVEQMTYRPLGGTGHRVSALGFGASALGGVFHATTEEECCQVVLAALKAGVNVIDTAPWYGQGKSENMLGVALKDVPREAYLINTKVGRYEQAVEEMFDYTASRVKRSVDESLQRLGLEYLDTVQIHDVEFAPNLEVILEQTLPALDELRRSGKVRMIGITGYALEPLREILERSTVKIDTVLSYCSLTLIDNSLEALFPFFASKGVGLYNAAPTGMGLLTPQGPPDWHPAADEDKALCRSATQTCASQGVDVARLALRTSLRDARLPSTFISCAKLPQMEANLRSATQELSPEEEACLAQIRTLFATRTPIRWEVELTFGEPFPRLWRGCTLGGSVLTFGAPGQGVELGRYWMELGKKLQMDRLYRAAAK